MVATKLEPASTLSKLKARQDKAIKLNYIVLFAAILLAPSNLGVESIAPARCSFKPGPRRTTRVDGEGRGLSTKPPYAANAND